MSNLHVGQVLWLLNHDARQIISVIHPAVCGLDVKAVGQATITISNSRVLMERY